MKPSRRRCPRTTLGGNPLPGGVDISDTADAGTGTITEDDAATLSIETASTAAEGAPVEFDVSLSAPSMAPVTVRWTLTATGDSPATLAGSTSDLGTGQATTGTVVFQANDTADKTVSITTTNDDRVEGSETFTITLSPDTDNPLPAGVTIPSAGAAGTGTITEDDAATVSIVNGAATEGFPGGVRREPERGGDGGRDGPLDGDVDVPGGPGRRHCRGRAPTW